MTDSLAIFMATNKFKCNKTAILKAIQGIKKLLLVKTLKWIQGWQKKLNQYNLDEWKKKKLHIKSAKKIFMLHSKQFTEYGFEITRKVPFILFLASELNIPSRLMST